MLTAHHKPPGNTLISPPQRRLPACLAPSIIPAGFRIHPQLCQDSWPLLRTPISAIHLHHHAAFCWLIVIPYTLEREWLYLPPQHQQALQAQLNHLGRFLQQILGYPRLNSASIGNLVAQMHLHVIGRQPDDVCWPLPVWGHAPASGRRSFQQRQRLRQQLRSWWRTLLPTPDHPA